MKPAHAAPPALAWSVGRAGLRAPLWLVVVAALSTFPNGSLSAQQDATLTASQMRSIERWLTCIECDAQERANVQALGPSAIPALLSVLALWPDATLDQYARRYGRQWRRMSRPAVDSVPWVSEQVGNRLAGVRIRAALSLGDLGATDALETARDSATVWGHRDDVARTVSSVLDRAQGLPPTVGSVRIDPDPLDLEIGASIQARVALRDVHDVAIPLVPGIQWQTIDPQVATADATGNVTAQTVGRTTLVATAPGGAADSATIRVLGAMPTLTAVTDAFAVDAPLGSISLTVVATDANGGALQGVEISARATRGGGFIDVPAAQTDAGGRATFSWRLGSRPGLNAAGVLAPGGSRVEFRAVAEGAESPTSAATGSLRLSSGGLIRGTVAPRGTAVAGVPVTLVGGGQARSATLDATGSFVFQGLRPEVYVLTTGQLPAAYWTLEPVRLPQEIGLEVLVAGDPSVGPVIEGYVLTPRAPVGGTPVELTGPAADSTMTDRQGRFQFEALAPGTYVVQLTDPALAIAPSQKTVTVVPEQRQVVVFRP